MYGSYSLFPQQVIILVILEFFYFTASHGAHHSICEGRQLSVVTQCIAIHHPGAHFFFRHQTESFHSVNHIIERPTLRERSIAMSADSHIGTILISVVNGKHLRKIIFSLSHTKQFRFQESHGRVAPASTCPVLILNGCNRVFLYCCKNETFFFFSLFFLCSNICCRERTSQHQAGNNKFLHLLFSIILAIIHFDANVRVLFLFSILLQLMILQL